LEPDRVYLHAGTRVGAKALVPCRGIDYLEPNQLPEPFHLLSPAEMEDCLCIYKEDLTRSRAGQLLASPDAGSRPQRGEDVRGAQECSHPRCERSERRR
jgi:hypothetical protein